MFSVLVWEIVVWPKLDHLHDFPVSSCKKRDYSGSLRSVSYPHVTDSFQIVSDTSVNGELPTAVRGILLIHRGEIVPTANPFVGLGPVQHKVIAEQCSDRTKVIGRH